MHEGQEELKKIFFVIPALWGGGAERVFLNILRHINREKFEPVLVLFEEKGDLFSDVPSDIRVVALNGKRILGLTWIIFFYKFIRLLRKEKPDVILSFMWYTNFITLLARYLSKINCRMIVSERYALSFSYEGWFIEAQRKFVIRFIYPQANAIVVNSEALKNEFIKMFRFHENKITVIYNPIDIMQVKRLGRLKVENLHLDLDLPVIVASGRLTPQKGFSYLIRVLRILTSDGIPCRLVILGKGKSEKELKKLAVRLGIKDRVDILGFQQNPYKYIACSTIFVLSSLYEGFPNVLLEALALGVPSIATRCPTGPEEIITDGVDGILVPPADEKALADAIKRLLGDEDLRRRLGEAGRKRAEDFRVDKIVKLYEDVIES